MANAIIGEDTGIAMEYIHLIKYIRLGQVWIKYFANEICRIAQGVVVRVEGTDTMFFCLTKIYLEK